MTVANTKKRALRAKVGDLAIARFDDDLTGLPRCSNEVVCLVTGCRCYGLNGRDREYTFIYWETTGNGTELIQGYLPGHRLTRCGPIDIWYGALSELTLEVVEPILEGEG